MNNEPLISVCIPAYNHENYVLQALDSVLSQDWSNKELVILNDGSSDATEDCVRSWISEHGSALPITFESQRNQGIPRTFNRLVDLSKGEYIAWLASDDYLLPGSLTCRIKHLLGKPERKAVFGDAVVVDENNKVSYESAIFDLHKGNRDLYKDDERLKGEFLMRWSVPGPVLLLHRSVYEIVGPYNESLLYEDWHFYLHLACRNLITYVDEKVAGYRWHEESTCRKPVGKLKEVVDRIETLETFKSFYDGDERAYIDDCLFGLKKTKKRRKFFSYFGMYR